MKVYAEIQDYGRFVGIVLTTSGEQPGTIRLAHLPGENSFLRDIERQVDWGPIMSENNILTGQESFILPISQVQEIFDALWQAGIRPTGK